MFKTLERASTGTRVELDALLDAVRFNDQGLVPAIAQQDDSGEVLMLAWMNRAAIEETLSTGRVCYYSRSRRQLWRKGETSGNQQYLCELRLDCDGDAVLLRVTQQGPACHTGRHSCFYTRVDAGGAEVDRAVEIDPEQLYGH